MVNVALNDVVILLIITIIQIAAIIYSWKMGKVFNSKSWFFIVGAFIFLLFRRVIAFLVIFGISQYSGAIVLIDRFYIPLVFWILILIGMMKIYYKIENSMEFEKKAKRITAKRRRR